MIPNMKSKGIAYVLWALSIFGWLGFHRFYLRKIGTGLIWIITAGALGVGSMIDLFTLGEQVEAYNAKKQIKVMSHKLADPIPVSQPLSKSRLS
jgi:TM2 domain-containing membrane protein YozV